MIAGINEGKPTILEEDFYDFIEKLKKDFNMTNEERQLVNRSVEELLKW